MEVFHQRLRQLRKGRGLSQQSLGELCGLSKSIISLYERGQADPTAKNLLALADVLNVSLDCLCGRD